MRRFTDRTGRVLLLLALAAAGGAPLSAQRMPGRMRQDRAELERRVRARFGEMVRERLGLTDGQSRQLGETVQSFQEDRMRLFREEQAARKRVDALMLEGGDDTEEARDLLTRMQELREEEARLTATEQEKLLEFLTPVQVLRFQALREEMGQRIRRLRGGGPGGAGGPGGPVGGELFFPER